MHGQPAAVAMDAGERVRTLVGRLGRRARWVRVAGALLRVVPLGLVGMGAAAWGDRLLGGALPVALTPVTAAIAALGVVAAFLWSTLRGEAPLASAARADRHYDLRSRISNAFELLDRSAESHGGFAALAIADAARASERVDPAVVLRWPAPDRGSWAAVGVASLLFGAMAVVPRDPPVTNQGAPPRPTALVRARLDPDDAAAFQAGLEELRTARPDAATQALVDRASDLVLALARGELGDVDAARALEALLERAEALEGVDVRGLERALGALGESMNRAPAPAVPLRDALAARDPGAAARALDELATRPPTGADARATASSLAKAAADAARRDAARDAAARETESLLRKRAEREGLSRGERSLLEKRQRELERLSRESPRDAASRRRLERLSRDLDRGGEASRRGNTSEAKEAFEDAAKALREAQRSVEEQRAREDLRRQLEQLREQLRRGQGQRGGSNGEGSKRDNDGNGGGAQGELKRFRLGAAGQGARPGGQGTASGRKGAGDGGDRLLVPGQGGGRPDGVLELPGTGDGDATSSGAGGAVAAGDGVGAGHEDATLDTPTPKTGHAVDTRVRGQSGGDGPTRSEVIRTAASGGFAQTPYGKVYDDYAAHAEDVVEREKVPNGLRYYVRRYFQLIRPRAPSTTPRTTSPGSP
ncbi:MAG: hypothetical protein R3A78_14575 [Polyangiales bacterium]